MNAEIRRTGLGWVVLESLSLQVDLRSVSSDVAALVAVLRHLVQQRCNPAESGIKLE